MICVTAAGLEDALSGSPFVGRQPEIARVRAAHADSVRTGTQVVCEVVGDPGIGKTRLVHAALDGCVPALPRAVGTCVEAERDIPFHVFRHAFDAPAPPGPTRGSPPPGPNPTARRPAAPSARSTYASSAPTNWPAGCSPWPPGTGWPSSWTTCTGPTPRPSGSSPTCCATRCPRRCC